MYNTIIVPVEMSHAEKAQPMIAAARQLGGDQARIVLISVVEDVPTYVAAELPGGVIDKAKQAAKEKLEGIAREAGANTEIEVRSGQASTVILGVAREKRADAIVIASHRPGLADYLLGSTAARVVRHAPCSVLVLR